MIRRPQRSSLRRGHAFRLDLGISGPCRLSTSIAGEPGLARGRDVGRQRQPGLAGDGQQAQPDGVYRCGAEGEPVFGEVPAPTDEALQAVLRKIIT